MSDCKEKVLNIACDLSAVMLATNTEDFNDWEDSCCRISDLINELQEVYEAMCKVKF